MAADSAELTRLQPPDYPAMFAGYVVRATETLYVRMADAPAAITDEFLQLCDHALHILTFALGPAEVWPAARTLLLAMAEPMEQVGARSEWIPYLYRAVECATAAGDEAAEAELSLRIGHLLRLVCDFGQAQIWLERGLHHFRQLGDVGGEARALNHLAYVDCLTYHDDRAVERAWSAYQMLEAGDFERAMSHFVLGMVASNHWEWTEAETQHRAALVLRERQGDLRRIAWSHQNIGYALQGQGRLVEAIDEFEAAVSKLEALGDKANLAITLMNLARTYHLANQLESALATALRARRMLHEVGDDLHFARHECNLGLLYLALHDATAAVAAFENSIAVFVALGNAAGRINTTSGLAMAYMALGQYAEAVQLLEPALAELKTRDDVPGKATLERTMTANLTRLDGLLKDGY